MRQVTIIVPVLNEATQILPFLRHVRTRAPHAEVIVVDGGSHDGTPRLCANWCDRLISSKPGRSHQMNTAARYAKGEILWFLHADNEIPENCLRAIWTAVADSKVVGGCFRVRIPKRGAVFRIHDGLAHYVGKVLGVRCGDHGIFVRRNTFFRIQGYRKVRIFEDVILFRAMMREGVVIWLPDRLLLSARRHIQLGAYNYTFICVAMVCLFICGLPSHYLATLYEFLVPSRYAVDRPLPPIERLMFADFRECDDSAQ